MTLFSKKAIKDTAVLWAFPVALEVAQSDTVLLIKKASKDPSI